MKHHLRIILALFLLCFSTPLTAPVFANEVSVHATAGAMDHETPQEILQRHHLDHRYLRAFLMLNEITHPWQKLKKGRPYTLPVLVREFSGKVIRTALDVPMAEAVRIRDYNAQLAGDGLKPAIVDDRLIWIPCDYVLAHAVAGQRTADLLSAYGLGTEHVSAFTKLNSQHRILPAAQLEPGVLYRLPIHIKPYSGPTISAALDLSHYDAKRILAFNKRAHAQGLKPEIWDDNLLWCPFYHIDKPEYGQVYRHVSVVSDQLKDCIFYLSPGHGGPDPGTVGIREGEKICEDEYALDITLRLARELESHGAQVQMLIRDEGIRDIKFLPSDSDEVFLDGQAIAEDLKTRLKQRVDLANTLYGAAPAGVHQRFLSIHIDFRSNDQTHVDFDLYHYASGEQGRQLAEVLQRTITRHYSSRLGGRDFVGKIVSQTENHSFYVIRETRMPAVLLELANINNDLDQLRFIVIDSRQRIAEWLCAGLIEDWQLSKQK